MKSQEIINRVSNEYFGKVFNQKFQIWKNSKHGRSQETLGKKIGVSRITISSWLNGKSKPKKGEHLDKICEAFNMEPEDFRPKTTIDIMLHDTQYAENYINNLHSEISEIGIDQFFFQYIIHNYSIPREFDADPFDLENDHVSTTRTTTPTGNDYTVPEGSQNGFIDQQDLATIHAIQNKVQKYITKEFSKASVIFERRYLKTVTGWKLIPPDNDTFNDIVKNMISKCPHLDPTEIIESMEAWANMKYKQLSESSTAEDHIQPKKGRKKNEDK